jgi:hypothetical protein
MRRNGRRRGRRRLRQTSLKVSLKALLRLRLRLAGDCSQVADFRQWQPLVAEWALPGLIGKIRSALRSRLASAP